MRFKNLICVSLLVALTGCASTKEKAQEKFTTGDFDGAASLFERALQENPSDLEAKEGLAQARSGILGQRLILVRQARTSGNPAQALDLLLAVTKLEAEWQRYPIAQARFTQEEETDFAFQYFKSEVTSALESKRPLKAEFSYRKYSPVFSAEKTASPYRAMGETIQKSGKESCEDFWKDANAELPYYSGFLASYCGFWKVDKSVPPQAEQAKLGELYSTLDTTGQIQGMPAELQAHLAKDLKEAFEASAFFHPKGGKKALNAITGNYVFNHQKNLVSLIHHYDAQEPYEDQEQVKKTRQVPYQTQVGTQQVTQYRNEEYVETQKVVRYRPVKKTYPYSALKHQQSIELGASANAQFGDRSLALTHSEKILSEGEEHDLTVHEVGLKPSRPNLADAAGWVKQQSAKLKTGFSQKLSSEWMSRYCEPGSTATTRAEVGELVHKCRRDKSAGAPAFIAAWYEKHFGLGANEAEGLLGIK